ncbi:MAG TPA: NIPSNAP family protein [Mucilaginibacter sp.]|nr:NIPSNAP family protein [Mucilaginibacter sp.]
MKTTYQRSALRFIGCLFLLSAFSLTVKAQAPEYYYRIRIFHYKTQAQEDRLDKYLKNALLPALHRAHIPKVGVFKPIDQDTTDRKIFVLIPFKTLDEFENTRGRVWNDKQYLADGKDFIDAEYNDPLYTRIEVIVLRAFQKWPAPTEPQLTANKSDRVYELRSYESSSEKLNINKVKMFNDGGETALFKRLNFNAVFYAEVMAGSHMPNLMYMTTFENKADRDKHWDTFGNDPEWKALVAKPEYAHNVSKADITFLHPTEYSDF